LVLPELSDFIESDFTAGSLSDALGDCANAPPATATLSAVDNNIFLSIGVSSPLRMSSETSTHGEERRSLYGKTPTAI
jgi:hypothetical protein